MFAMQFNLVSALNLFSYMCWFIVFRMNCEILCEKIVQFYYTVIDKTFNLFVVEKGAKYN
jgi:hypothetical protein